MSEARASSNPHEQGMNGHRPELALVAANMAEQAEQMSYAQRLSNPEIMKQITREALNAQEASKEAERSIPDEQVRTESEMAWSEHLAWKQHENTGLAGTGKVIELRPKIDQKQAENVEQTPSEPAPAPLAATSEQSQPQQINRAKAPTPGKLLSADKLRELNKELTALKNGEVPPSAKEKRDWRDGADAHAQKQADRVAARVKELEGQLARHASRREALTFRQEAQKLATARGERQEAYDKELAKAKLHNGGEMGYKRNPQKINDIAKVAVEAKLGPDPSAVEIDKVTQERRQQADARQADLAAALKEHDRDILDAADLLQDAKSVARELWKKIKAGTADGSLSGDDLDALLTSAEDLSRYVIESSPKSAKRTLAEFQELQSYLNHYRGIHKLRANPQQAQPAGTPPVQSRIERVRNKSEILSGAYADYAEAADEFKKAKDDDARAAAVTKARAAGLIMAQGLSDDTKKSREKIFGALFDGAKLFETTDDTQVSVGAQAGPAPAESGNEPVEQTRLRDRLKLRWTALKDAVRNPYNRENWGVAFGDKNGEVFTKKRGAAVFVGAAALAGVGYVLNRKGIDVSDLWLFSDGGSADTPAAPAQGGTGGPGAEAASQSFAVDKPGLTYEIQDAFPGQSSGKYAAAHEAALDKFGPDYLQGIAKYTDRATGELRLAHNGTGNWAPGVEEFFRNFFKS